MNLTPLFLKVNLSIVKKQHGLSATLMIYNFLYKKLKYLHECSKINLCVNLFLAFKISNSLGLRNKIRPA